MTVICRFLQKYALVENVKFALFVMKLIFLLIKCVFVTILTDQRKI